MGGIIDPLKCPKGTYRPNDTNLMTCQPCPEGTFGEFQSLVDKSNCTNCPEGVVCIAQNLTINSFISYNESLWRFCPEGYICPRGTSMSSMNRNKCKPGKFCTIGMLNENDTMSCPPGRLCEESASAKSKDQIIGCTMDDPSNCYIGEICPVNNFCPSGTGNRTEASCVNRVSFAGARERFFCARDTNKWDSLIEKNRSQCFKQISIPENTTFYLNFNFKNISGFAPDHYDLEFITTSLENDKNIFYLFKNQPTNSFSQIPLRPEAKMYLMTNDFNFTIKFIVTREIDIEVNLIIFQGPFYPKNVSINCNSYVTKINKISPTNLSLLKSK